MGGIDLRSCTRSDLVFYAEQAIKGWDEAKDRVRSLESEVARLREQNERITDRMQTAESALVRLATIVDEAFGLQPVMPAGELLSALERNLFESRQELAALLASAERLERVRVAANELSDWPELRRWAEGRRLIEALAEVANG